MRLADEIIRLFSGEEFFKNSLKLIQNCIIKDNSLKEQEDINTRVMIQGLSGGSKNAYIYSLFKKLLEDYSKNKNNKKVPRLVYITTTAKESEEAFFDIKTLSNESPYLEYFPDWGTIEYEHISPFQDIIHQRIEVLHKLVIDEPLLIIMPIKALMRTIVPPDIFRKEYIDLKTDEDYNLESLLNLFIELGYERVEKVAESGTFTLKGGILDIFPSAFENPARIEFWGDTIESIRLFDPISQKSIQKNIKDLEILPQRELIYTDEHISRAIDIINERFNDKYRNFNTIIENLLNKQHFQGVEQYQPFFYPEASIIDYLDDSNAVFVFNEKENIEKFSTKIIFETESLYNQSHRVKEVRPRPDEIYQDFSEIKNRIKRFADISTLIKYDENYDDEEFPVYEDEQSIVISAKQITSEHNFRGDFSYFTDFLEENPDKAIIIMSPYEAQARRLQSALARYNPLFEYDIFGKNNNKSTNNNLPLKKSQIYIAVGNYNIGFGTSSFYLIPDREIRGKKRSYSKKLRRINSAPIESFLDLKKGDYVVHINYGIGKFIGIERMKIVDKERDFIHILYADEEKLYVPIEQLNLVQKYIGGDVRKVKLDKMGGKSWERTKKRVQKSIEDMAEELLKIYSARKKLRGYAFSKDTPYQLQFESEFIYEETPDQIKAIEEVKRDMELDKPMDRLICGDVGYGKTEVAIRSAFKTIMDGKQVAVLVPTTISCEPHYLTFKERFKNYPVVVEMLSRFRTKAEQKSIIKSIKNGKIDIIVGTHRLLSKDINFKNLGMLIIDEEQRFGVKHKEKLKKLRTLVDVISMSATPIPRTLHMSLTSIRDMSVINTPPENRLPIQTYTMEFNEDIIRDAILKEMERGGQVYFLYNKVKTIKSFAQFVMKIVPEARVAVGHGQMEEDDLERIIREFINKKYDVLVCTTIIENGIDIENVNTILIDRADTFGLSQLYQLRGRVGRGDHQAYCYLFYPADRALTEVAQKRLSIINEFTDLGSGFKIAMRDMEMRGAGNVLGPEQSGDIIAVGYEMYTKMLDDTIKKISTGEKPLTYEMYIDLDYDGYIPDEYIKDEKQKMEVYKRIAGCLTEDDVTDLLNELRDRFGEPPQIVKELMKISELKAIANRLKIPRIQEKKSNTDKWAEIEFKKFSKIDPIKIFPIMKASKGIISINPNTPDKLYLKIGDFGLEQKVDYIKKTLEELKRDEEPNSNKVLN